ncbi:N-acetyltransferase [Actinomadura fibrosa]|uniref:N-acetyltransferase n=1 Tax=Actinomadura fibrosa TaxID=111802 RepID=A0ABW2XQ18_9ACTN|nr:N-acetyltransferase [Actinomadura fibrosa]
MTKIEITTCAERPGLVPHLYGIDENWPVFMRHDPVGNALLGRVPEAFPEHCVVATDGGRVVARGQSVPYDATLSERREPPARGWDGVLVWAFADRRAGRPGTAASALDITIDVAYLGQGLSRRMLAALRDAAARQGHDALWAPVRPTEKHLCPHVPMDEYIQRRRGDGLPADPWLRVHARVGGVIGKVAPASMTISGSLDEWRRWTGLPFDRGGAVEVPGALVPVHCDTAHGHAVYVEPNVWVRHGL